MYYNVIISIMNKNIFIHVISNIAACLGNLFMSPVNYPNFQILITDTIYKKIHNKINNIFNTIEIIYKII